MYTYDATTSCPKNKNDELRILFALSEMRPLIKHYGNVMICLETLGYINQKECTFGPSSDPRKEEYTI